MSANQTDKASYMISVVAERYNLHPQTLRLYEREGLLKPSRTEGNTRLYSEEDLVRLETILSLTRDLGVNLAGEVNEFMNYVKQELERGLGDWEERLGSALVKSRPQDLVRPMSETVPTSSSDAVVTKQQKPKVVRKRS